MRVSATGMLVAEGGGARGLVEREQSGHLSRGLGGSLPHHHATADPQELRVVQEAAVDTALLPRGQGVLGGETQRQQWINQLSNYWCNYSCSLGNKI